MDGTIDLSTLTARRAALAEELESGAKLLADLEAQRTELQQTMLRISGALQVLDELLAPATSAQADTAADAVTSNGVPQPVPA